MGKYQEIELISGETISLTEKELMFCEHYLTDANRNATQAAIKAGYSSNSARRIATQNLSKVHINKYLESKTKPILEQLGATQARILQEWVTVGLSNITDFMNSDYSIKNLDEVRKMATGAIESVQVEEKVLMLGEDGEGQVLDRKVKFKLHDKLKGLERLSEMVGLIKKEETPAPTQNLTIFQNINHQYNSK